MADASKPLSTRFSVGIAFILVASLLAGGLAWAFLSGDRIRDALNANWPPIDPAQQRQAAVDSALAGLATMSGPNFAVGVDTATVEAMAAEKVKDAGVTKLAISADRQLLKFTATFKTDLKPGAIGINAEVDKWLADLKPHVEGEVEVYLTAAATVVQAPKRMLQVKLLPALKSVHIDQLTLSGSYDVTEAAKVLASVLNTYADNITGAFANEPILHAELPASIQEQFDPSKTLDIAISAGSAFKVALKAEPISSPYGLGAVSLMIHGGNIAIVAHLTPVDQPLELKTSSGKPFNELATAFSKALADGFGLDPVPGGAWVAIRKELLADTFNSAFAQANACLTGSGPIPEQTFQEKIPTPDAAAIDCTPTQACDLQEDTRDCRRSRNCQRSEDTRNCRACLLRAPRICVPNFPSGQSCSGGHCIQEGNDPICEAQKAAQNGAYEADYLACLNLGPIYDSVCEAEKATQNGLYAADRAKCEAEKTAKKLGCETMKGAVDALHRTGNVGNFNGAILGAANLSICLRQVTLAKDLTGLSASLETTGSAGLDPSFKFTPLDVAGHVLCQLPWTASEHIDVTVPAQTIAVDVSLAKAAGSDRYQGGLKATPIKLHFEPSPLALVLQNINFQLACPITASLINGMTLNLAPFIPEFLKDYRHTLDPIKFSFVPQIPDQPLLGQKIKSVLSDTPTALVVQGTLEP